MMASVRGGAGANGRQQCGAAGGADVSECTCDLRVSDSNEWLGENNPEPNEIVGGESLERGIGMCQFKWHGLDVSVVVMPYRIFMLQRIQDAYDELNAPAREAVDALLAETGLSALITTRCARRVERENHREIWR